MKVAERRNEVRVSVSEPVRLRPVTNPVSSEQMAETVNMSQRGICVATNQPMPLGTLVELYVRIPRELSGEKPAEVRCVARVVHVGNSAAGRTEVGMRIERYESLSVRDRWVS